MANDALQDFVDSIEPLIADPGSDTSAYHDNEADEIHTTTAKGTPVGADVLVIEDSAAGWVKKRIAISGLPAAAPAVHATSHEDGGADEIAIEDLATAEVTTTFVLNPDGAGGVAWGAPAGGGADQLIVVSSDAAVTILNTTRAIQLEQSAVGSKTITTTSSYAGQVINIILLDGQGGDYTAPGIQSLVFNTSADCGVICRDSTNSSWYVVGATGANIA
jgi:hypothetical protein